jgi:hypothetical protein
MIWNIGQTYWNGLTFINTTEGSSKIVRAVCIAAGFLEKEGVFCSEAFACKFGFQQGYAVPQL